MNLNIGRTSRAAVLLVAIPLAGVLVVSGIAAATIPSTVDGKLTACVKTSGGAMRLIDYQAGVRCVSGERTVSWSAGYRYRGAWSSTATYAVNDIAVRLGSSYLARKSSTNVVPGTDSTAWRVLAAAGAKGATGPRGLTGATGATGPTGAQGDTGAAGADGQDGIVPDQMCPEGEFVKGVQDGQLVCGAPGASTGTTGPGDPGPGPTYSGQVLGVVGSTPRADGRSSLACAYPYGSSTPIVDCYPDDTAEVQRQAPAPASGTITNLTVELSQPAQANAWNIYVLTDNDSTGGERGGSCQVPQGETSCVLNGYQPYAGTTITKGEPLILYANSPQNPQTVDVTFTYTIS